MDSALGRARQKMVQRGVAPKGIQILCHYDPGAPATVPGGVLGEV